MFERVSNPVFIKEDSDAQRQLEALETLAASATNEERKKIDREIKLVKAGIAGEKSIEFELKNSHMPMYVLHDLRLEKDGVSAQIDFLVVTQTCTFIIECKNLVGDIEVNSRGDFIRTLTYGTHRKREGIYNPITQNQRHLDLIKDIRSEDKGNFLTKAMFLRYFDQNYRGIVVLANQRTVLNDRYAKREVKEQIIRADQLVTHMKTANKASAAEKTTAKEMQRLAEYFLARHIPNDIDYTEHYRSLWRLEAEREPVVSQHDEPPACPRCGQPMVRRTAQRGAHAGDSFWGCPGFPKCRGTIAASKESN